MSKALRFFTDNGQTTRFSFSYRISNNKNFENEEMIVAVNAIYAIA